MRLTLTLGDVYWKNRSEAPIFFSELGQLSPNMLTVPGGEVTHSFSSVFSIFQQNEVNFLKYLYVLKNKKTLGRL